MSSVNLQDAKLKDAKLKDAKLWGHFRSALASEDWAAAVRVAHFLKEPGARESAALAWERALASRFPEGPVSSALEWYRALWGAGWALPPWHPEEVRVRNSNLRNELLGHAPDLPDRLRRFAVQGHPSLGRGAPLPLFTPYFEHCLRERRMGRGLPVTRLSWRTPERTRLILTLLVECGTGPPPGRAALRRGEALFRWRLWVDDTPPPNLEPDQPAWWALTLPGDGSPQWTTSVSLGAVLPQSLPDAASLVEGFATAAISMRLLDACSQIFQVPPHPPSWAAQDTSDDDNPE
jgi:hypothetical protein